LLWQGVRDTNQFSTARSLLHAGYVAALLWYLIRSGHPVSQIQDLRPVAFPRWKYTPWISVLVTVLVLLMVVISVDGVSLLMLLMIVAAGTIIVVWRGEITLRQVIQGILVAMLAFFAGLPMMKNGFVNESFGYLFTILAVPMYIAGGLLLGHTRLGGLQLLTKQYLPALRSFLLGCLLFVPPGLANAASGSTAGSDFTWVKAGWMPLSLPWWSGLIEETWFRLLLVGLVYFLLRPAFPKHPAPAVLAAVLFSGVTFGLWHGRTLDTLITTGLLYGVPFATLFTRRDWEHAVGAHYMVNMIPWVIVFLQNHVLD